MLELFSFAYFPKFETAIQYLAETLADKEQWDFGNPVSKKYVILKNYLEHTFRKLKTDNGVSYSSDNKFACFNTGLTTGNQEDIFAYFEELKNKKPGSTAQFCFRAFLKKSDHQLLTNFSGNVPDCADYFKDPELLIFNPKYELIPDIDHIISDNKNRFPSHMTSSDGNDLRRRLVGSIDEVKRKARSNYKLAVPQYYNGRIQLLLPLCLTSGSPNPDLALVLYRLKDKTYSARTCLTIQMAYNNARLIVKPQSDWLKP